jgi:hypothetical protein
MEGDADRSISIITWRQLEAETLNAEKCEIDACASFFCIQFFCFPSFRIPLSYQLGLFLTPPIPNFVIGLSQSTK